MRRGVVRRRRKASALPRNEPNSKFLCFVSWGAATVLVRLLHFWPEHDETKCTWTMTFVTVCLLHALMVANSGGGVPDLRILLTAVDQAIRRALLTHISSSVAFHHQTSFLFQSLSHVSATSNFERARLSRRRCNNYVLTVMWSDIHIEP